MVSKNDEVSLDPENWDEIKELGHRMLEDMIQYLQYIREEPFQPPTKEIIDQIYAPLTNHGEGEEKVYNIMKNYVIPYSMKFIKPQFWGLVCGAGSPFGVFSEMLRATINYGDEPFVIGGHLIKQSLDWIKELLELPQQHSGAFVSGGSEANFTGLAVARNDKAMVDVKKDGIQRLTRKMTCYCSEEGHACLDRSVELLGLGNDSLRWIKTTDNMSMNVDSLKNAINEDRKTGSHPFCIIGTAGSTNTGAFDNFTALRSLANHEDMWLHVDGAFGSWIRLSESHKHLANGIEFADSVAVDLHKWMNMPYAIACAFIKDQFAHFRTFVYGHDTEYLDSSMDVAGDVLSNPFNLSLALSRAGYSVKAYMLLRAYGKDIYRRLVQQNIDQIGYLAELVKREPCLEITVPLISNVLCFKYRCDGLDETELEKVNRSIMRELWKVNWGIVSDTTIRGKYMLRVCNVNHRTSFEDFDILVEQVKSIGNTLIKEYI
jgi:glutamate/tyrosine decarboxylase-like PLP-dependent enzyme